VFASSMLYKERVGVIILLLPLGIAVKTPILIRVNALIERQHTFLTLKLHLFKL